MELYIARHGQTMSNVGKDNRADSPLTDLGKAQVQCLGKWMADVDLDCIISSPLQRAVQTAQAVAEWQKKPMSVELWPSLMEYGTPAGYEGKPIAELQTLCPTATTCPLTTERSLQAETWTEGLERAEQVISTLRQRFPGEEQKVLLVAHGHFNNQLLHAATGLPWHPDFNFSQYNGSVSLVRYITWEGHPHTQFTYFNSHAHLPKEMLTGV